MSTTLPHSLSHWNGAEQIAAEIDAQDLCRAIDDLVDYILTEDCIVLDSLPEDVEISAVTPLGILAGLRDDGADIVELVVGARLVRESFESVPGFNRCSSEVISRVLRLPR